MARIGEITMTMRELDRLKIFQALTDGNLKPGQAAQRPGLTTRQVLRLSNRFRDEGPAGLIPVIIKHPLTSQDRLVKELRLQNISTMVAANAYAPTFIADYKCRFAKPPRNDFNAHRPVSTNEDLNLIFTCREPHKVS